MKKYTIVLMIIAGLFGLATLCCRDSKEVRTLYLRACDTGRLIGPIRPTPGYRLPQLDEQTYIVANPAESELEVRKRLLETRGYESHYFDCELAEVVGDINRMLKSRLGDNAPPVRIESADESNLPLITMDISGEVPAYDVLCNIAAQAKVRLFIENGAAVLSYKPLKEIATKKKS